MPLYSYDESSQLATKQRNHNIITVARASALANGEADATPRRPSWVNITVCRAQIAFRKHTTLTTVFVMFVLSSHCQ